jgi:hypothetical protein
MKKYIKKPIAIEAMQFFTENIEEVMNFLGDFPYKYVASEKMLIISTLEGDMLVRYGDYIIKGIYDEFYPCKPDIFEDSYSEVQNQTPENITNEETI